MLIYNHNKEFLGIDESDLKALSISSLTELQSQVSDFADLFVKSPGYVHNFKHIHWIDYIGCSEGNEDQKVLIQIKERTYSASVTIRKLYLTSEPLKNGYIITLNNIKELPISEGQAIAKETKIVFDPYDVTPNQVQSIVAVKKTEVEKEPRTIEDINVYSVVQDTKDTVTKIISHETPATKEIQKSVESQETKDDEKDDYPFSKYIYNPLLASEDLGLPIDLIEEFVQDFIAQANGFKETLYNNLKDGNLSNLKTSAHKLKGVAANLKIEDALDALTKVYISQDADIIGIYLERFYKVIDKLSSREIHPTKNEPKEVKADIKTQDGNDLMVLTFKEDTPKEVKKDIKQESLADLADDEFLKQPFKPNETLLHNKEISIENRTDNSEYEFFHEEFTDSKEIYSKKTAAQEIGLDLESFNILFDDYLIQSRELANEITKYSKEGDLARCKSAAAKLKEISKKMIVDSFDEDLKIILDTDDTTALYAISENITSTLDKLSNVKG